MTKHIFTREYYGGTSYVKCSCGWKDQTRDISINRRTSVYEWLELPHKIEVLWEEREAHSLFDDIDNVIKS